jgi:poly(3-hydroxybutyrate) depolymerase
MPPAPGDVPTPAAPAGSASAGCGLASGIPANAAIPNSIVTFPAAYDGTAPMPLVFAFHGAGRTNEDMRLRDSRTNGSQIEASYVVAYMKSAGNAWDLGTDYPRFDAELEQALSTLCVDTSRVFAFGHSSGAQFIVQMLGNSNARETRLAGVVEVASSRFQNPAWSPLPTLVIHGLNDNQRGGDESGASDIVQYTQSNQCTGETRPLDVPGCASLAEGAAVDPGCVEYVGCAAPTLFCNHDDPNYIDNGTPTNHGWPCFANTQIFQFFESVR